MPGSLKGTKKEQLAVYLHPGSKSTPDVFLKSTLESNKLLGSIDLAVFSSLTVGQIHVCLFKNCEQKRLSYAVQEGAVIVELLSICS